MENEKEKGSFWLIAIVVGIGLALVLGFILFLGK